MTELHNMSVPPRTMLTVKREALAGRRYGIDLLSSLGPRAEHWDRARVTRRIRDEGAAYLLKVLGSKEAGSLRDICTAALEKLGLPNQVGFFVQELPDGSDARVPPAAAVAILAARSGRLYMPGRFEASLIEIAPTTLFFPATEDAQ